MTPDALTALVKSIQIVGGVALLQPRLTVEPLVIGQRLPNEPEVQHMTLRLRLMVPDTTTGETMPLTTSRPMHPASMTRDGALLAIKAFLVNYLVHELLEGLVVGTTRPFDPHGRKE